MTEYQEWTVVRLKEELESQGLSQTGKKADLIQRLLDGGEKTDSETPSSYDQWRAEGNIPKKRIKLDHTPIEKGEWIGSGERRLPAALQKDTVRFLALTFMSRQHLRVDQHHCRYHSQEPSGGQPLPTERVDAHHWDACHAESCDCDEGIHGCSKAGIRYSVTKKYDDCSVVTNTFSSHEGQESGD